MDGRAGYEILGVTGEVLGWRDCIALALRAMVDMDDGERVVRCTDHALMATKQRRPSWFRSRDDAGAPRVALGGW